MSTRGKIWRPHLGVSFRRKGAKMKWDDREYSERQLRDSTGRLVGKIARSRGDWDAFAGEYLGNYDTVEHAKAAVEKAAIRKRVKHG